MTMLWAIFLAFLVVCYVYVEFFWEPEVKRDYHLRLCKCGNYPTIDIRSSKDANGNQIYEEELFRIYCCDYKQRAYMLKSRALAKWNSQSWMN